MFFSNGTTVTYFIITGFPGLVDFPQYYGLVSAFLFFLYLSILAGNIFIITFVFHERSLQKPTYLVFCNLAVSDMAFGTTTLPRIIAIYWLDSNIVDFNLCFTQMFFVHFLGATNSFLITIMSLDRYIAICHPFRYAVMITNTSIWILMGTAWLLNTLQMVAMLEQAYSLAYCDSNVIAQCYCDHTSVTRLTCDDLHETKTTALGVAMFMLLCPLSFTVFSYISIIVSIMRISNSEGRGKAFSTCSPQLFIICLYYIPRCFVYLASHVGFVYSADSRVLMVMIYSLLPPLVNPLIYCFRTKEIKDTLKKRLTRTKLGIMIKIKVIE